MILGMTNSPTLAQAGKSIGQVRMGRDNRDVPGHPAIDDCHSAAQDFLAHEPACKCLGIGLHVPLGRVETLGPA
jgi:hypothetical protein